MSTLLVPMTAVRDVEALARWISSVTSRYGRLNQVRQVEQLQPALRPNGRRLRAVEIAPNLFVTRDARFFHIALPGVALELQPDEVLARTSLSSIIERFRAQQLAHHKNK